MTLTFSHLSLVVCVCFGLLATFIPSHGAGADP